MCQMGIQGMRRLSQFLLQLLVHLRKIILFGGIIASAFTTKIILQGNYKMIFCLLKRVFCPADVYFTTSLTRRTAMPYNRDVSAVGVARPF